MLFILGRISPSLFCPERPRAASEVKEKGSRKALFNHFCSCLRGEQHPQRPCKERVSDANGDLCRSRLAVDSAADCGHKTNRNPKKKKVMGPRLAAPCGLTAKQTYREHFAAPCRFKSSAYRQRWQFDCSGVNQLGFFYLCFL